MKILKTVDLLEMVKNDWTINNGMSEDNEFNVDGECAVVLQNNNICYLFPITIQKTIEDYIRFIRSHTEAYSSTFYHGFLFGTLLDVIYEDFFEEGACLKNRKDELNELKKDVEAINKIMSK